MWTFTFKTELTFRLWLFGNALVISVIVVKLASLDHFLECDIKSYGGYRCSLEVIVSRTLR